jgi:hypothetical protein
MHAQQNGRRRIESGDSFSYYLDPGNLLESAAGTDIKCVFAEDAIGRSFRSSADEIRLALAIKG